MKKNKILKALGLVAIIIIGILIYDYYQKDQPIGLSGTYESIETINNPSKSYTLDITKSGETKIAFDDYEKGLHASLVFEIKKYPVPHDQAVIADPENTYEVYQNVNRELSISLEDLSSEYMVLVHALQDVASEYPDAEIEMETDATSVISASANLDMAQFAYFAIELDLPFYINDPIEEFGNYVLFSDMLFQKQ